MWSKAQKSIRSEGSFHAPDIITILRVTVDAFINSNAGLPEECLRNLMSMIEATIKKEKNDLATYFEDLTRGK